MARERRPQIPTELRRLVLVEAGHRCAIHTCRAETVDIHHIDGWASTKEHQFESLIALCPTCHRRADTGEIDRKSLRLYKARLAAAFSFHEAWFYPKESLSTSPRFAWCDPGARWRTLVYRDSEPARKYTAEIEYPELAVVGPGLTALNSVVLEAVQNMIRWFRCEVVDTPEALEYSSPLGYEFNGSFSVALLSERLASIRFGIYTFSGGAHGSHWTQVVNSTLQPFSTVVLRTLFRDVPHGLTLLSGYCRESLLRPTDDEYPRDEQWVREGTAPEERNFEAFNLAPEGILISFDDYHVGPYAAGPCEVLVPYTYLRLVLADDILKALEKTASFSTMAGTQNG